MNIQNLLYLETSISLNVDKLLIDQTVSTLLNILSKFLLKLVAMIFKFLCGPVDATIHLSINSVFSLPNEYKNGTIVSKLVN